MTIQNRLGMPRKALRENVWKASLLIEIELPLVISRPMPRSEVSVASVMMKGGSPILTMPKPWNMPMATPTSSVARTARKTGTPALISIATITVPKPTTAPTERSMPPVMMTKVWPTARIAIIEPCRRRLEMLLVEAKLGVATDRMIHNRTSSASSVRPNRAL
jgi:hypothetical protein